MGREEGRMRAGWRRIAREGTGAEAEAGTWGRDRRQAEEEMDNEQWEETGDRGKQAEAEAKAKVEAEEERRWWWWWRGQGR
eukprot:754225-Hanusia_phi.AAC.2